MRYRGDTLLDSVKRMGVTEKGKLGTNEEKKHGVRGGISICRRQTPCSMVRAYFIPMCAE